jgi:hypothetical protein
MAILSSNFQDYADLNHIMSMCLHEASSKAPDICCHLSACSLPPPRPKDEYTLGKVFGKEANIFAEYTGLYGSVAKSAYQGLFPNTNSLGKQVDYQGSRQMDNFSRRYYEKELGAGVGPSMSGTEH